MWTRERGYRCGVMIPLYPLDHHYVVTEPIDGAFDELPVGRDPDLCIYFRGEGNAVMLGAFQALSKPWMVEPVPDNFSFRHGLEDRKSTRLNSSHVRISYAVFCLKK